MSTDSISTILVAAWTPLSLRFSDLLRMCITACILTSLWARCFFFEAGPSGPDGLVHQKQVSAGTLWGSAASERRTASPVVWSRHLLDKMEREQEHYLRWTFRFFVLKKKKKKMHVPHLWHPAADEWFCCSCRGRVVSAQPELPVHQTELKGCGWYTRPPIELHPQLPSYLAHTFRCPKVSWSAEKVLLDSEYSVNWSQLQIMSSLIIVWAFGLIGYFWVSDRPVIWVSSIFSSNEPQMAIKFGITLLQCYILCKNCMTLIFGCSFRDPFCNLAYWDGSTFYSNSSLMPLPLLGEPMLSWCRQIQRTSLSSEPPTNTLAPCQVHQLQLRPELSLWDAVPGGGAGGERRGDAQRRGRAREQLIRGAASGGVGTATAWTPPLLMSGALHVLFGSLQPAGWTEEGWMQELCQWRLTWTSQCFHLFCLSSPRATALGLLEDTVSWTTRWEREESVWRRVGQWTLSLRTLRITCITSEALCTGLEDKHQRKPWELPSIAY